MNSEANKAIVRRYMEMWNTGNVALADEVLAPTWQDHAPPEVIGPKSVKQAVLKTRATLSDFTITIESMLSEGDLVALQGIVRAGSVSHVMWFVRLADGKMLEMRTGTEVRPAAARPL